MNLEKNFLLDKKISVLFKRANELINQKLYEKAIVLVKEAYDIVPTRKSLIKKLVFIYQRLGKFEEALKYSKKLILVFPNQIDGYKSSIEILLKQKNIFDANTLLEKDK